MPAEEIRNFSQFLASHSNGSFNDEVSVAFNDMIAELSNRQIDSGGKQRGKLSVEVNIELDKGIFYISASKKVAMSKDTTEGVYWATADNTLTRNDPKQPDMFKDVKGNSSETRTA